MKTPNGIESVESSMEYCKTQGISIFSKLQKSMGSDDILYGLVSKTVWQSPFELALIWINMVAKEEWSNLADNPTDNLDTRNHKLETRKHLHFCIMAFLSEVNVKPTMLQKLTTRLFVSEKLASTLPTHDQDRVLASALMLPYKKWKQVLGVLTHLDLPDSMELADLPSLELDEKGEDILNMRFHGDGKINTENVPGVIHKTQSGFKIVPGTKGIILSILDMNAIKVSDSVMRRFDGIMVQKDKEAAIRGMVLGAYSGLPVWKKRSFGGDKPADTKIPEGKLAWNF